jgi:hypothetical protein
MPRTCSPQALRERRTKQLPEEKTMYALHLTRRTILVRASGGVSKNHGVRRGPAVRRCLAGLERVRGCGPLISPRRRLGGALLPVCLRQAARCARQKSESLWGRLLMPLSHTSPRNVCCLRRLRLATRSTLADVRRSRSASSAGNRGREFLPIASELFPGFLITFCSSAVG